MKNVALLFLFWISTAFLCLAQNTWQNYNTTNSPLLSNRVSAIAVDQNDNLWGAYAGAGGNGDGVVKFNGTTWVHFNTSNSGLPNNDVRAITVDPQGNLWFACYNAGIVKFNGTTWTPYNTSNSGIAGNDAITIKFDHNNRLWVGCYFSGISKFDGATWTTYDKSNAPFPDSNCVDGITIGKDNSVWVGLACGGGLAKFSQLTNTWTSFTQANSGIPDHTVTSIIEDIEGKIWMSFINSNISSFDGTTWTHYDPGRKIYGFALDQNGNLWGCGNGLFKFIDSKWHESGVDGNVDNYSYPSQSLAFTSDGRAWWSVQQKGIWTNPEPSVSSFERTTNVFKPVYAGKIEWVDLDNDQDLDLLYCGDDGGSPLTMVYENVNGVFQAKATVLPDIINGSFATGDYDNDGDLDVLISGVSVTSITRLYKNLGNFSFSLVYSFPGLVDATMSWVDLDLDNDLDFVLAGTNVNQSQTYVYENNGGAFVLVPNANLPPCTQCSMDWADSNSDGKIDLLISGLGDLPNSETSLYLNNGNKTFTKDQGSVLKNLFNGNVQWGDFDNDADMDALISGLSNGISYSLIYENNNGVLEERTDIAVTSVSENWYGGTTWADFNGDGYLDILVTGKSISQTVISYNFKVFLNDGQGKFTEAFDANLPGITESSVDCADYDGDGDLDIGFLGITSNMTVVTNIYKNKFNEIYPPNTPPTFSIAETIEINEDFQAFTVQPEPASVPPLEQTQTIVYSIKLIGDEKVSATINPATGKITFVAIPDAFGNTSFKVTANDGQVVNGIFSATIQVNVIPVNDAPVLSAFEDMELEPGSTSFSIPFTIQDVDHSTSILVITATSSNHAVVSDSKIAVSGDSQARTLNIVPEEGAFGETTITVTVSDGESNVTYNFKITIPNVTSIEQTLNERITLFPNPVLSNLTVAGQQINGPFTIIVSDLTGREVLNLKTTDKSPVVDMTDLNPGVYILRIRDSQKISSPQKIVKSN